MRRPLLRFLSAVLAGTALSTSAAAQGAAGNEAPAGFDRKQALATSQAAIGEPIGAHSFRDRAGGVINLAALRGRPLVLSLVYTSCSHSCSVITRQLARAVDIAREALGEASFTVVSVGFDTAFDTPARMADYARRHGVSAGDWWFVSGDETTVAALAGELGFLFFPSAKGFDHLAQTSVVDADGRVYRQIYGELIAAPMLVEPLKELVFGQRRPADTVGGWLDRVRLFCTIYDPASGRYGFDYSIFVGIAVGLFSLGLIAVFIVHAWRDTGTRAG